MLSLINDFCNSIHHRGMRKHNMPYGNCISIKNHADIVLYEFKLKEELLAVSADMTKSVRQRTAWETEGGRPEAGFEYENVSRN